MHKRLIGEPRHEAPGLDRVWLNLEALAEVELTSEDTAYPIESALMPTGKSGWRAATPGHQTIRLRFPTPQDIHHIHLVFSEPVIERTQEYVLRWSPDNGQSFREVVRQQWNFSPSGATVEVESYDVALSNVTVLELSINPGIGNPNAVASLERWKVA